MLNSRLIKACAVAQVLVASSIVSQAQNSDTETLLTGNQVTREALINALRVDPTPEVKTRGLRLYAPSTPTDKPHKASLLITFAVDSAKLTKESMGLLDTMADAMLSNALAGSSYLIEGHADPRGDEGHNLTLSQQRAESVADYLVDRHGIARSSLYAKGKGSSNLLNTLQTDAPENRRVTFLNLKQ
jgi:outer membrane protein OmpA-like peptidoglycan-associated protein